MIESVLVRRLRRVGLGVLGLLGAGVAWEVAPGLPFRGVPTARPEVRAAGLALFTREWRPNDPEAKGDGLGPVFNARSCAACHFQGGVGGGGGERDVVAFEVHPGKSGDAIRSGMVHAAAITPDLREKGFALRDMFPKVKKGCTVQGVCFLEEHDFERVRTDHINSTALFGAGYIDRISGRAITHGRMTRTVGAMAGELTGGRSLVPPGRARVLADGRIGKFGWKAQFATLEEFTAAACSNELGLGTPKTPQAIPLGLASYPEKARDLDARQFGSLVSFVDTLPRPREVVPGRAEEAHEAARGKGLFMSVGCAECHTPEIGGVDGVYSDFLLHTLNDPAAGGYREVPKTPLPENHPRAEEWKTPPLWGVADSAPYFHDGASPTLESAILRHGADAQLVTDRFTNLKPDDRAAIVAFLKTLRAPADAEPVAPPTDRLARAN